MCSAPQAEPDRIAKIKIFKIQPPPLCPHFHCSDKTVFSASCFWWSQISFQSAVVINVLLIAVYLITVFKQMEINFSSFEINRMSLYLLLWFVPLLIFTNLPINANVATWYLGVFKNCKWAQTHTCLYVTLINGSSLCIKTNNTQRRATVPLVLITAPHWQ